MKFGEIEHIHIIKIIIITIYVQNFSVWSETIYPLNNNSPFSPLSAPGNHHSTFCFLEFDCSRSLM